MYNSLIILLLLLAVICLSLFILLFGENPRLKHGIVGSAHRLLTSTIPRSIQSALRRTLGQSNLDRLARAWGYTCQSRNPLLQVFFMVLTSVSIGGFLVRALPHVPNAYLGRVHLYVIPVQIIWLYVCYYIACTADPGTITSKNIKEHLALFPYDGLIFEPKNCSTCDLVKPARSKHCSMCHACIAKADHHCAWLNQCVGYNNHRFFLLFLFNLTQFCAYGAYLCFQIYSGMIIEWGLDHAYFVDRVTGEHSPLTYRQSMVHIFQTDRIIGSIGILAIVVSMVVFIFAVYQVYLAGRGITTNEAFKWELIQDAIDRGELWVTDGGDEPMAKKKSRSNGRRQVKPASPRGRQILSFDEVENVYDRGFFNNLYAVIYPEPLKKKD
ncbi:zf-DHHC-domain-containing protein [Hesseltinella vesiculosa]|uniref:Palmitoyltransferase n=1 Tax=Hesseltinella vesiculosa TaxID=101127 RepID=A0A1X2GMW6_9FUNG|nr:zf-DHHC-domain-containing protein [Hesseltinella vesiculosa]